MLAEYVTQHNRQWRQAWRVLDSTACAAGVRSGRTSAKLPCGDARLLYGFPHRMARIRQVAIVSKRDLPFAVFVCVGAALAGAGGGARIPTAGAGRSLAVIG